MSAVEIIKTQIRHIFANLGVYSLMGIPIIIGNTVYTQSLVIYYYYPENYLVLSIVGIILLYTLYYNFRYLVNTHRFIILSDKNSFFSPLIKFKETIIYFLYLVLFFIFLTIFILLIALLEALLSTGGILWNLVLVLSLILLAYLYSLYGLILPKIALGEKVSLKSTREQSKGYRKVLLYQFLIIYLPFWFVSRILTVLMPEYSSVYFSLGFSLFFLIVNTIWVGSLSITYKQIKEAS